MQACRAQHLRRLAVVGTFVADRVWPWQGPAFSDLGGLIYTILPLAALCPGGWQLVPVAHVGADLWPHLRGVLARLPAVSLDGLIQVRAINNRVTLRYTSVRDRVERLEGGVPALGAAGLQVAGSADFILLNYVSGAELTLSGWRLLRASGRPIYADLHSLVLGRRRDGLRYLRRPPAWRERLRGLRYVQLNEVEAACLLGTGLPLEPADRLRLRRLGSQSGAQAVLLTEGERGAWFAPTYGRRPPAAIAAIGGPGREPTGCGDAFAAGFMAALLHGRSPAQAALAAVRCAGIKSQLRGPRRLYAAMRRRRSWILGRPGRGRGR